MPDPQHRLVRSRRLPVLLLLGLGLAAAAALLGLHIAPLHRLAAPPPQPTATSTLRRASASPPAAPTPSARPGDPTSRPDNSLTSPDITANTTGQPVADVSGNGPSPNSTPTLTPAPLKNITIGPACGTMTFSGSWTQLTTTNTGCGGGYYRKQTGVRAAADWVLTFGIGASCTFTMPIPYSPTITSTRAEYQLFDASTHSHLLSRIYLEQASHRGTR